jgi:hypothetical protein
MNVKYAFCERMKLLVISALILQQPGKHKENKPSSELCWVLRFLALELFLVDITYVSPLRQSGNYMNHLF